MTGVIWSNPNAAEVLFLVGAVCAFLDSAWLCVKGSPEAALLPAAVLLIALGLLAA